MFDDSLAEALKGAENTKAGGDISGEEEERLVSQLVDMLPAANTRLVREITGKIFDQTERLCFLSMRPSHATFTHEDLSHCLTKYEYVHTENMNMRTTH